MFLQGQKEQLDWGGTVTTGVGMGPWDSAHL